jgi:hypothetical protein
MSAKGEKYKSGSAMRGHERTESRSERKKEYGKPKKVVKKAGRRGR